MFDMSGSGRHLVTFHDVHAISCISKADPSIASEVDVLSIVCVCICIELYRYV